MRIVVEFPAEIVRLRRDHNVVYVRLPRWWRDRENIGRGEYVVVSETIDGSVRIETLAKGISRVKGADNNIAE